MKWAQTLDGQLCDDSHSSQWISGKEERLKTHILRKEYDAVLVGASTFIQDKAKLTVRNCELRAGETQPVRIIIDLKDRVLDAIQKDPDIKAEFFDNQIRRTILLGNIDIDAELSEDLEKHSVLYEPTGIKDFNDSRFFSILEEIFNFYDIEKIMIEGGARVLSHFIKNQAYDEIVVSMSTKLTGGSLHHINAQRLLRNAFEHNIKKTEVYSNDVMIYLEPNRFVEKGGEDENLRKLS